MGQVLFYIFLLFLGAIGSWIVYLFVASGRSAAITRSLNMGLFLVSLPQDVPQEGEPRKQEKEMIAVMEQFYTSLTTIKEHNFLKRMLYGNPHLAFEIVSEGEHIKFYLAIPRHWEDLVEKQIHGFFPKAEILRIEDYSIFEPKSEVAVARLKLAQHHVLPIRTYQRLETDPLGDIVTALSKLTEEEGAAVQIIFRPAVGSWREFGTKIVQKMRNERVSYTRAASQFGVSRAFSSLGTIGGASQKRQGERSGEAGAPYPQPLPNLTPIDEEVVNAIEGKIAKLGFEVNIRLVASAPTKARAQQILEHLKAAFVQFSSPHLNSFRFIKPFRQQTFIYNYVFRNFDNINRFILNTEELTSIFHFPIASLEAPKVMWVRAKVSQPPVTMPREGLLLGKNTYRSEEVEVRITRDDRRRHLYIVGQTGTGKSTLLYDMVRQDIERGEGVAVIDPHGDLVEALLGIIPQDRAEDVILFDPADTARPMGLNMLEYRTEEQKDFAVQEMIAIFYKLFPPEMIGPIFEHNMRNAMLTLMADKENPGTIIEIPRIFTDETFQRYKVSKVTDLIVRQFWEKEVAKTTEFHKSEILGYLISKVGRFVENEMMRNIIGQPRSGFDFREVMDKQKILLVNISRGKVGEVNSALLGLIIVSKLQMAAMGRVDTPQEERKDFYLYIDEFQNFTTDSIATILAEARKYRLDLTMAHQFIGQLTDSIRNAVFGNVGSLISFRVGPHDAEFLVKQFSPVFTESDLVNLDNYNAYVKLMIDGGTTRPFNMTTYPPKKGSGEVTEAVREFSRLQYGKPKEIVEKEIFERGRLGYQENIPQWYGETKR